MKTMSTHTPGPWGIRSTGSVGSMSGSDKGDMICFTYPCDENGSETPESRANARLIAAAPEMKALLADYAAQAKNVVSPRPGSLIERTRALLARIEGRDE